MKSSERSSFRCMLLTSCAIAVTFMSFLIPRAGAQPGPASVKCVETLAINARYVFVGTIVEILDPGRNGANTNVVVNVEKILKGELSYKTQARIDVSETILVEWKKQASRLLIFNGVAGDLERAIDLSDPDVKVLTADLKVLRNPDQIIKAAQKAIERHPGVYGIDTFARTVPGETAKLFSNFAWFVAIVPADADLEHWAISALDSKQAPERAEAVAALGGFPSEANATRLKRMLDDPGIASGSGDTQVYFVRQRAYESLKRMGVKVPEPTLQKEIIQSAPDMQSDSQKRTASLQTVTIVHSSEGRTLPGRDAKLAFSDADHFYAIGNSRAIVYVPWASIFKRPTAAEADVMFVANVVNFEYDDEVRAISSDGRKAILATGVCGNEKKLAFLDTATGQRQEVPSTWYDSTDSETPAALSSDGHLLSTYSDYGPADSPMTVTVYNWTTKTLVAKRTSENISAGGSFSGGVTTDGQIEFVNNRVGRKVVDLKTGRLLGMFGYDSVRSLDGAWIVDFPDHTWNETTPMDVLIKDGATAQTHGKLNLDSPLTDDDLYGSMTGAFCGNTGRFVVARAKAVALYSIPSGNLLANFPVSSWRDPKVDDMNVPTVACSPTGTRVAILSGVRLTFHDLK